MHAVSTKRALMKFLFFAPAMLVFTSSPAAYGKVELTPFTQTDLGVKPLDVAASADGKLVFLLAPGKLLVYSVPEKRATDSIVVDASFDRISYSENSKLLILTSGSSGKLRMIRVEPVKEIDISGHPFKGPADAPVILAVFDDYQ